MSVLFYSVITAAGGAFEFFVDSAPLRDAERKCPLRVAYHGLLSYLPLDGTLNKMWESTGESTSMAGDEVSPLVRELVAGRSKEMEMHQPQHLHAQAQQMSPHMPPMQQPALFEGSQSDITQCDARQRNASLPCSLEPGAFSDCLLVKQTRRVI